MEFTINAEYLKGKVDLLKGITKVKSLMPVTRNVLMTLAGQGGTIRATDLEVSAITELRSEYDGPEPKQIMVNGGVLSGILEGFAKKDVNITQPEEDKGTLVIRYNKTEIGLAMQNPEDFPEVKALDGDVALSVPGVDIMRGINKVLYAVSADESRYTLTGILIEIKGWQFRMCATDGFRVALYKKDIRDGATPTPQILVPGRNIKMLKETIDDKDDVDVVIDAKHAQFMTPVVTLIFRTIEGAFPDYESLIPSNHDHMIFIRRVALLDSLKHVAPLTKKDDNVVFLNRDFSGGLTISVETSAGYAVDTIDCEYKSQAPFQQAFNLKFILDAIEHMDADQISITYPEGFGAAVFEEPGYTCLVMPIRGMETPIIARKTRIPDTSLASPGEDRAESTEKKLKFHKTNKGNKADE
jgi:DNA polymerase-3 subunit beta